jgi:hypothetical protein
MKKIFIIFSLLSLISASLCADFTDEFDSGVSPLWKPVSGIWEAKDNIYHVQAIGVLPAFSILPFEVTDGTVIETDAMITTNGTYQNAYLTFAYVNDSDIYVAALGVILGQWAIGHTGAGGWNEAGWFMLSVNIDFSISTDVWYHLRLEIHKSTVSFFANNDLKVEYKFPNGIPKGKIGIGVVGSDALFDNVKITGVINLSIKPIGTLITTWASIRSR